ncbi:hypothetical protein Pan161_20510 [Gimesia algae]|uniref:Uncharacterized protein n=1 Tax=Gimesia algae TaxID=2527971 RepID=A0A517VBM0_9PLAN|nr:hypothetical protein Pan161_20510 [Gimesia algae]
MVDVDYLLERNRYWQKSSIAVESSLFYRVSRPEIELFAVHVTSDSNNPCPIPVSPTHLIFVAIQLRIHSGGVWLRYWLCWRSPNLAVCIGE